jgi:hypothetical protein
MECNHLVLRVLLRYPVGASVQAVRNRDVPCSPRSRKSLESVSQEGPCEQSAHGRRARIRSEHGNADVLLPERTVVYQAELPIIV